MGVLYNMNGMEFQYGMDIEIWADIDVYIICGRIYDLLNNNYNNNNNI